MKIVNKKKFIKTMCILLIIILLFIILANKTYSKVQVKYREETVSHGDTLWGISKNELSNNKYFEDKDIREVVNEIKKLNNLKSSDLSEGQKLIIPIYN